jgi:hypothetical protein
VIAARKFLPVEELRVFLDRTPKNLDGLLALVFGGR